MKPVGIRLDISLLGVALVASVLSSALLVSSPPLASAAYTDGPNGPSPESLCGLLVQTTYCNAGPCGSYSPNPNCPGGWMYYCNQRVLRIYQAGQQVGESASTGWFCSTEYTCITTC
jgi:hypothetical protein